MLPYCPLLCMVWGWALKSGGWGQWGYWPMRGQHWGPWPMRGRVSDVRVSWSDWLGTLRRPECHLRSTGKHHLFIIDQWEASIDASDQWEASIEASDQWEVGVSPKINRKTSSVANINKVNIQYPIICQRLLQLIRNISFCPATCLLQYFNVNHKFRY